MARIRTVQTAVLTVVAGLGLAVTAGSAAADTATTLYVNNGGTTPICSDDGAGTYDQPFCTLAAAVAAVSPGQTVRVTGTYHEHLTINKSGTPDKPITFQGAAALSGSGAGITISGQHDIVVQAIGVYGTTGGADVAVTDSSHITLSGIRVQSNTGDFPGFQLSGVTDSLLARSLVLSGAGTGIVLDATTTGVKVQGAGVAGLGPTAALARDAVDVAGSANTIVGGQFRGNGAGAGIVLQPDADHNVVAGNRTDANGGSGIVVQAGADHNVVANNVVRQNLGDGIDNSGASATAVTSNTVVENCGAGIRIDGASSGVSAQNNIASLNGENKQTTCDPSRSGSVDIGVYDSATAATTVDYNIAYQATATDPPYAWGTPMASLADFQAASGQGTHDIQANPDVTSNGYMPGGGSPAIDSANSAAPGEQSTDWNSKAPEDDPDAPDTGAGPTTYADRGAAELVKGPTAQLTVTPEPGGSTESGWPVTVDASKTVAGWVAIATYRFDFGDGTPVTQSDPVVHHVMGTNGRHTVTVGVTDVNGATGQVSQSFEVGDMYVPDGPVRVLDTRSQVGVSTTTPVAPFGTVTLTIAGTNDVPSTGVSAVVLNVTVTAPTTSGFLTVYPDGQDRPNSSNLNWTAGETIPNLVTVPVADGKVSFYNGSSGTVHVVADLTGYYANVAGALFTGVTPQRSLDTRSFNGSPVPGGGSVTIPAPAGATAAVLNVTVTEPTASGYLTVYPDGQDRPTASNLNWTAGKTIANLVTVPVVNGKVRFYNASSGTVHVIADLFGYYMDQDFPNRYAPGSPYAPFGPTRLLDTRTTDDGAPVAAGGTIRLPIAGTHGIPGNASAVVLNVTVTAPTMAGFLTAYPDGQTRPTASNLNWTAGETVPNLVVVPLGLSAVDFYNGSGGTVHVVVDIVGYFPA